LSSIALSVCRFSPLFTEVGAKQNGWQQNGSHVDCGTIALRRKSFLLQTARLRVVPLSLSLGPSSVTVDREEKNDSAKL